MRCQAKLRSPPRLRATHWALSSPEPHQTRKVFARGPFDLGGQDGDDDLSPRIILVTPQPHPQAVQVLLEGDTHEALAPCVHGDAVPGEVEVPAQVAGYTLGLVEPGAAPDAEGLRSRALRSRRTRRR